MNGQSSVQKAMAASVHPLAERRRKLEDMSCHAGLSTRVFGFAEDALASLASAPPNLIVTGLRMPGMNDRELAEQVVRKRPGIRVLYMSGFIANVIAKEGILARHIHFLPKPFSSRALAGKIRSVLESDPGEPKSC